MDDDALVVRADSPLRAEREAHGWRIVASSWGAEFVPTAADEPRLAALVERVADRVSVRALDERDVDAVLELDAATIVDYPGGVATRHEPMDVGRATPDSARRAFGAFSVAGSLVAMTFVDVDGTSAETDFTVVSTAWRGAGIGTAVKAASVLALFDEGIARFRTGGSAGNAASIAANERVGYLIDEHWVTLAAP